MIQDALLLIPPPHMADGWDVSSKVTCHIGLEVWARQWGDITMDMITRQHRHNDSRTASQRSVLFCYQNIMGTRSRFKSERKTNGREKSQNPNCRRKQRITYYSLGSLQKQCPPSSKLPEQHQSVRSMMFQFLLTCLKKQEKAEGLHRMIIWFRPRGYLFCFQIRASSMRDRNRSHHIDYIQWRTPISSKIEHDSMTICNVNFSVDVQSSLLYIDRRLWEVELHLNSVLQACKTEVQFCNLQNWALQSVSFAIARDGVFQKQKQNCSFVFVFATPLATRRAFSTK